ncbi:polysaccharide pyruvyl transferase family protein [Vallitaleaceae bacterium 9-2]
MKKIGVLTFHRANNYGAILQAYSLYKKIALMDSNYEVEIININYKEREIHDFKKYNLGRFHIRFKSLLNYYRMKRFLKKNIHLSPFKLINSLEEGIEYINHQNYDLVITGSDEVWKTNQQLPLPNIYWLPSGLNCKKLSYAASANRTPYALYPDEVKKTLSEYLMQYTGISVRDEHTKTLVSTMTEQEIHIVSDPTFLIEFPAIDLREKIQRAGIDLDKPVIAFMGTNKELVETYRTNFGPHYEYVSFYQHLNGTKFIGNLNPFEFVQVFRYCSLIVTSFFHGTVFSILNKKPFISFEMKQYKNMESKIHYLLKDAKITDRYFVNDVVLDVDALLNKSAQLLEKDGFNYDEFIQKQRHYFEPIEQILRSL